MDNITEKLASRVAASADDHDELLNDALLPLDSYAGEVYWADLPSKERSAWIHAQNNAEAKRELKVIGTMAKENPLSPVSAYFSRYV